MEVHLFPGHRSPELRTLFVCDQVAGRAIVHDPFVLAPSVEDAEFNIQQVDESGLLAALRRTIDPADEVVSKILVQRREVGFKFFSPEILGHYLRFAQDRGAIAELQLNVSAGGGMIQKFLDLPGLEGTYDVIVCLPPGGKYVAWVPSRMYRLMFPPSDNWLIFLNEDGKKDPNRRGGVICEVRDMVTSEEFEAESLATLWHFWV